MKPHLSVLCLFAISDLTEILDAMPKGFAELAKTDLLNLRAWTVSYRRYWRTRI